MKIIQYSVRNPLIVNLLMGTILILGTISLIELPRELHPRISFNYVFIIVPYPGVGAEEIEKVISIPLEEAVRDIDDIKMLTTESTEGSGFCWMQFEDMSDADFQKRLSEVESEVNSIDFPDGALDPIVDDFSSDDFIPVISVSIAGDIPERELHDLAENLRDDLLDEKGVARVALSGTREREIWIEVSPEKLFQYRLSLAQVVQSVAGRNINLPAGEMNVGRESYLVRTVGEVQTPGEFGKIVVRWDRSGSHLYLGQIATVRDHWKKESSRARINGSPAATLSISKRANANSLEVIERVKEASARYSSLLPTDSQIIFTNDNSIFINDILSKLQSNALLGFLLVILILYVFMGFRNALVAAIGIPISFMATFIFMAQTGQTFNGSSLFGLILILGVVVDDAIIVVENCFRHRQYGKSRMVAAVDGTREVFWPVVAATLTTIAAFLPLILMTGIIGKFMRIIPIVVSLTLLASLVEVFLIAPSHFAEWGGLRALGSDRWFKKLRRLYSHLLVKLIRKRWLIGPGMLLLVAIFAALIPLVGVELFSGDEWSQFWVWVTMPPGTKLEDTDRVIQRVETAAKNLREGEVHAIIGNSGVMQMEADWIFADHVGQVIVDVVEKEFRSRSTEQIMDEIRTAVAEIEGPVDIKIQKANSGPPTGKPVEIKVKGKRLDMLVEIAEELKASLAAIPGVYDIGDDNLEGKREVQVLVDEPRASLHGLSVAAIAMEIRTAITGVEATIYRDADDEIDVRVMLAGSEDLGIEGLRGLSIMTPTGQPVRLDNICRFVEAPSLFRIRRFEEERALTVNANIDKAATSAVAVNTEISRQYRDINLRYPGYSLDFRGEFKEFQEAFGDLGKLFLIGVLLIFTILGAQFKSVRQSLIILLTVPSAFIGSMIGLLVGGNPFSILTMYGMIALAGIAVNDAIVMVSFINNARANGAGKWRSIIESGRVRLRPIILTSFTTILGLMPMAIGLGGKSDSWGPLANTIVWGLAVATLLTLFVIPTVYSIAVDEWFGVTYLAKRIRERRALRN